jgi:hypothetical protein
MRDASVVAAKQVNRAKAAGSDYEAGVASPQADWQRNTLASDARRKVGLDEAEKAGRWKTNVAKTSSAEWQKRTLAFGSSRYTDGVEKNADKYANYIQKAAPIINSSQAQIAAMPNATADDNKKRMLTNFDNMKKLKGAQYM